MRYKLKEVSDIGSSKRIFARDYESAGVPFYRGKEILQKINKKHISNKLFISEDKFNDIKQKYSVPKENDILITAVGTIGGIYLVKKSDLPFYFKDGNLIRVFNIKSNLVNPQYLYYLLASVEGQNKINSIKIGSTQSALTIDDIRNIEFDFPNIETQKNICNRLSPIEKKISLNNQINDNLEYLLQNIFEEKVNNSEYKKFKLTDIACYTNGLAMQKFRPTIDKLSLPVLKIRELAQGFTDPSSDRCSSNIRESVIVNTGDIIFSWSGTLLVKLWSGEKAGLNQHLFKVTSDKYPSWFIYEWTKFHLNEFQAIATDKATTMGHIKRSDLKNSIVYVPNNSTMKKLNALMEPIYSKKIELIKENNELNQIKTTILRKFF